MNYAQQIKHPMWQKKRLQVLNYHGFKCQVCGVMDEELHVHHPFYTRGAMIWDYATNDLQSLCQKCHKDAHSIDEHLKKEISELNTKDKSKLLKYVQDAKVDKVRLSAQESQAALIIDDYTAMDGDPAEISAEKFFRRLRLASGEVTL